MKAQFLVALTCLLMVRAPAQSVLFNFENAPQYASLPLNLTVGGVNVYFTTTGQGYSVQLYNCQGLSPAGFSGLCLYPGSVSAADLIVDFSVPLTDFSILYAPEEYACDSSATMRVTAYLNGTLMGTSTTNAQAGTWPSETLRFSSPQTFNHVVVHYDAPPVTGGDYGPIFMADNMAVTPAPQPIVLKQPTIRGNGAFQFSFTYLPYSSCTVWSTTNLALAPTNWNMLGTVTENPPGSGAYKFTDLQATNLPRNFYRVSSP